MRITAGPSSRRTSLCRQRGTCGSARLMPHRAGGRHHRSGCAPRRSQCRPVHARLAIGSARDRTREVRSNLAPRRAGFTSSLAAPLAFSRRRIDKLSHLVVGPRRLDDRLHHALKALGHFSIVSVGADVLHEGLDLRRVGITGLKRLLHLEKRPVMDAWPSSAYLRNARQYSLGPKPLGQGRLRL